MAQITHTGNNSLTYIFTLIKQYVTAVASKKVDKVDGKQLSTNDYTTQEKQKLAGLSNYSLPTASTTTKGGIKVGTGLEVTVDGTLNATGGGKADSVDWTNVIGKPTKLSQFTNDSNFLTSVPAEYVTDTELTAKGYQTAAQVDASIQKVVASAPAALDTLNEIAAALNNDANFAGTMTTELSKKANTADFVELTNQEIQNVWDSVKV